MLEHELNLSSFDETSERIGDLMASRSRALHFLQEFGWLLQRRHVQATSEQRQYCTEGFSVARFRWLLSFAIDQEWCAVVKKLLNTMFRGDIDVSSPIEFALGENLLVTAVNKRSKPLVQFLLRYRTRNYAPDNRAIDPVQFLFTPDMTGPSNITPLHIAATISDATSVLDALTDDPQQLGIKAWKNARDDTGLTPEDYAQKRGHISYIQMVQDKIDRRLRKAHVSVAIPSRPSAPDTVRKHGSQLKPTDQTTFNVEKSPRSINQPMSCRLCVHQVHQLAYRPQPTRLFSTRPAMLSLVAIAAVCVCVGLIMKSPPHVNFMKPFLWEKIRWGPN